MSNINPLSLDPPLENNTFSYLRDQCLEFVHNKLRPKYILGRNMYADSIVKQVKVDGFVDDFTKNQNHLGLPILKTEQLPGNALVLIAACGRPLTAKRKLDAAGLDAIDYFSFYKWSGLNLPDIMFNENFTKNFLMNKSKFDWAYQLLSDDLSRTFFQKLVLFRMDYNLNGISDFENKEDVQYFEPFLNLKKSGEVFVDVGGYDGYTSEEFSKHCPHYAGIHIFEPDAANFASCQNRFRNGRDVFFYQTGLSDAKRTLNFHQHGSGSHISDSGESSIKVDRLDNLLKGPATFIKMDIEGAEIDALEGAKRTILDYHPTLAISAYHHVDDFWRIPEKILSIRDDYRLYLRHYTESIYETVMFFLPTV